MIGVSTNWKKLCKERGFKNVQTLFKEYRSRGKTYNDISYELGVSPTAVWNKALDLMEQGKLHQEDLRRRR
jgi:DNA-binding Lrp family transcriptional regulator